MIKFINKYSGQLKIIVAMLMLSPLYYAFFGLDFGNSLKTFTITFTIFSVTSLLGIIMFNYLESGYDSITKNTKRYR